MKFKHRGDWLAVRNVVRFNQQSDNDGGVLVATGSWSCMPTLLMQGQVLDVGDLRCPDIYVGQKVVFMHSENHLVYQQEDGPVQFICIDDIIATMKEES